MLQARVKNIKLFLKMPINKSQANGVTKIGIKVSVNESKRFLQSKY